MSRAFIKEDVDPPERSGRKRSASGLPPGATNYMTALGAKRLREKLQSSDTARREAFEELLASATIVDVPDERDHIAFGAKVTVRAGPAELRSYRIVGVDELDVHTDGVSWMSPIGKALLAAEVGDRLMLPSGERVEVIAVEYPDE